jgi:cytochrome c556
MRALLCATSVLLMLLIAGLVTGPAGAQDDEKVPSVKKIMGVLHGKKGVLKKAGAALKGDSPDWEAVLKDAKVIEKNGEYLVKNGPEKGEKASWEKLSKAYAASGKALKEAAEKEDLKGARAAAKKLGTSCKTCHDAHKE